MRANRTMAGLCAAVVAACGGGGSTVAGIDGGGALPPMATTIASQGKITGFGSIVVNGVRFDTSGATFTIDGAPGSEGDLAIGQVVLVLGTIDSDGVNGVAESVRYEDLVEGPVEAVDTAAGTLTVLGQTVVVSADTSFEDDIVPRSLDGLSVGDVVEVSGFLDSNQAILATRIELEDDDDDFEVTGFAANVDPAQFTLDIGGLTVDYSGVVRLDDFPTGMPEDGQLVEATGSTFGGSGELLATELEFRGNDLDIDDVDEAEIEGPITRFASATDFDVNGIPVTTTASTEYEDGTSADLGLNRRVEVEGSFNANGVLVAEEIEFEVESAIEIAAVVDAVSSDSLTMLGIDVLVDDETAFDDFGSGAGSAFGFGDVAAGDYLEVYAYEDGSGGVVATRIERDDDPDTVELTGPVGAVDEPEFSVLGVTVRTDGDTEFEDDDADLSASEFFAQALGRLVEVEGTFDGEVILAEEVELDD